MFNWAKQQMANAVGTEEPIYGPSAMQSVAKQAETTPYTELTSKDLTWENMQSTSVETQAFYIMADSGHVAMAQIIHSNVGGFRTTAQFNCRIFYPKEENKAPLWSTDNLTGVDFSENKNNYYAENCAIELSEDGTTYTIKSMTNPKSIVNLTVKRGAPGFQAGENGRTYFGTDPAAPWGNVRHAFWPRNTVEGTIVTEDGPLDMKGKALFIQAIQGMKPHHAAAKWKFAMFQGPHYSAVLMELTTPPSYGSSVVTVGGVTKDDEILTAGTTCSASHSIVKDDPDNEWPEPEAIKHEWTGETKDGKKVTAILEGPLDKRVERVDLMAEIPGFVKSLVASAVGTKPYIYQYATSISLKVKVGEEEITEEGRLYAEATFICA